MLRKLLALTAILMTTALVGCELENGGDTDSTTTPDTDVTNPDTDADTTPQNEYKYVRMDDLSETTETPQGGSDIDAVILFKGGTPFYATNFEYYEHGGGMGEELNPEEALGAPDAFKDWPDSVAMCDVESGYVSLGGLGGSLIVLMDAAIEAGDQITVLEVGGCNYDDDGDGEIDGEAIAETVEVSVSIGKDPTSSQWISLGSGTGPEIDFAVPALP